MKKLRGGRKISLHACDSTADSADASTPPFKSTAAQEDKSHLSDD